LSYNDVDHLNESVCSEQSDYSEVVNLGVIALNVSRHDIRLMFSTRSLAQLSRGGRMMLYVIEYFAKSLKVIESDTLE